MLKMAEKLNKSNREAYRAAYRKFISDMNHAAAVYYSGEETIMSDKDYDYCYSQLISMESASGIVDEDSPSLKVGYKVLSELRKVEHKEPALSLDKTKERDKLEKWLDNKAGILSWKLDGLTAVATYKEGKLVSLVTRGNGYIGEDVTHNAPFITGLPKEILIQEELTIRGEVVISYESFERINDEISNPDQKYKNPRNLASASLRLLDNRVASRRCMHLKMLHQQTNQQ